MSTKLSEFVAAVPAQEPPAGLFERILLKIQDIKAMRRLRNRLCLFAAGLVATSALVVVGMNILNQELGASAFGHYFSLIFTDTDIVFAYWQDTLFDLLESIPVLNIMAALAVSFFCLGLIRLAAMYRDATHRHMPLAH